MTEATPSLENTTFSAFFKNTVLRPPFLAGGGLFSPEHPPPHSILSAAHTTSAKEAMPVEKRRKENKPMEKAREMSQFTAAKTDPQGSWTGCPADPYEVPVQDADDL